LAWLAEVRAQAPAAEWHLVGGMVRDAMLGRTGRRDFDFLVRGVGLERLSKLLEPHGRVDWVGRSFGVLKFRPHGLDEEIDIAWPRTERAGMSGAYRDFEVSYDPSLPVEADLARRDFTVNAMAWRLDDGNLVDPYGGLADLEAGCLRAVGDPHMRFQEDRTRIMRGLRFACELGFRIEPATWQAMGAVTLLNERKTDGTLVVAAETVAKELVKALVAAPAEAARLLEESGALAVLLPEMHRLAHIPQRPEWHSEGDVWTHTRHALAALTSSRFNEFFPGERPSPLAVVAVLLHDVGKGPAMKIHEGRLIFWGHAEIGADLTRVIAERLRLSSAGLATEDLVYLVREHMFPHLLNLAEARRTSITKRFVADRRLGDALLHLHFADVAGSWRQGTGPDFTHFREVLAEVRRLREAERPPLLSGSQVMDSLGLAPGPEVGRLLEMLREEQLNDRLDTPEAAKEWLRGMVSSKADTAGV
jgi:poly(A) polymerase